MLYMPKTRFASSDTRDIHPQAIVADEGIALVSAGNGQVKAGSGTSGEVFLGFSLFQRGYIASFPHITENFTPKTGANTQVLPFDPLGGTLNVFNANTGAKLAVTTNYTYDAASRTITFVTLDVPTFTRFEYSPTQQQLLALQGSVQPGGTVPQSWNYCGVISKGDVYTSAYEVGDDWSAANLVIRVGANGKLTTQGSGAIVDGYVIGLPNHETPFLGISLK